MTKQFFLCIMACTLAIAPGCTKRTKIAPEQMSSEQLEAEHKKYKNRGIGLTTGGSVATVGGLATTGLAAFAGVLCSAFGVRPKATVIALAVVGPVVTIGGIYMLGQGIHDLAKAKTLRRIQMKKDAQQRKLEREQAQRA